MLEVADKLFSSFGQVESFGDTRRSLGHSGCPALDCDGERGKAEVPINLVTFVFCGDIFGDACNVDFVAGKGFG